MMQDQKMDHTVEAQKWMMGKEKKSSGVVNGDKEGWF